jgi:hypothetical protein
MTEINFIDGQALDETSFGEFNATTGVWQPIEYTGTYGTNGFYLNFSDNTSTTTLGEDQAGSNDWTTNNFSVTAGAGNDSLVDTPTNYGTDTGVGGEVRGNYATLNPLIIVPAGTISNGNLDYNRGSTASHGSAAASFTLPTTGKWYWEVTACKSTNNEIIGIANIQNNPQLPSAGNEIGGGSRGDYGYRSDGNKYNNGSQGAYGATYTSGDVIGVAWDSDSATLVFYKNGVSQGTAFSSITQAEGKFAPAVSSAETSPDVFNFGQRPFAYTAPSGFKALCTQNLPEPTIVDGGEYFNTVLYTGNGSTQSITGVGFQPDMVWVKDRSATQWNNITDVVRGVGKEIFTNATNAEETNGGISSFNADGFSLIAWDGANANGDSFVAWNWKANGAGVSNTDGTITSTVSANTDSGFSIVTYTGTGTSNPTVGHGLGAVPAMIIAKDRDSSTTNNSWFIYHKDLGAGYYLNFTTDAQALISGTSYGAIGTSPSSTVFTLAAGTVDSNNLNESGDNYVAYCFAAIPGYSAFGSYTGNGSTDGPFVYTGFRPRYVFTKRTDSSSGGDWTVFDSARNPYNIVDARLYISADAAENSNNTFDFLSNGFKLRQATGSSNNMTGGTYIYAAFAENPFKYSLAR